MHASTVTCMLIRPQCIHTGRTTEVKMDSTTLRHVHMHVHPSLTRD